MCPFLCKLFCPPYLNVSMCGEPAISLHSHHVSLVQWTTRLLPITSDPGSNPWGDLFETGILLLALSRYIGDPDVIDHFCGLAWGGLCPEPSLGPRADNVIIPLYLTQLSVPVSRSLLHNRQSRLLGGGGSPVKSLQSHFIFTMSHWSSGLPVCFQSQGTQVQNPWGDLSETGILLLALSNYRCINLIHFILNPDEPYNNISFAKIICKLHVLLHYY